MFTHTSVPPGNRSRGLWIVFSNRVVNSRKETSSLLAPQAAHSSKTLDEVQMSLQLLWKLNNSHQNCLHGQTALQARGQNKHFSFVGELEHWQAAFRKPKPSSADESYLFRVHADGHLTVQVAFGDHVGTAGVDHSGRFQGLHKRPANRLVAVPPCHLLNRGATVTNETGLKWSGR